MADEKYIIPENPAYQAECFGDGNCIAVCGVFGVFHLVDGIAPYFMVKRLLGYLCKR